MAVHSVVAPYPPPLQTHGAGLDYGCSVGALLTATEDGPPRAHIQGQLQQAGSMHLQQCVGAQTQSTQQHRPLDPIAQVRGLGSYMLEVPVDRRLLLPLVREAVEGNSDHMVGGLMAAAPGGIYAATAPDKIGLYPLEGSGLGSRRHEWQFNGYLLQVAAPQHQNYGGIVVCGRTAIGCLVANGHGHRPHPIYGSSGAACVAVSPHWLEVAVVGEHGGLGLWTPARSNMVQSKQPDRHIGSDVGGWWGVAYTDSPCALLLACKSSVMVCDTRAPRTGLTLLTTPAHRPLCGLTAQRPSSQLCAVASTQHVLLLDMRQPNRPVLEWAHHQPQDPPTHLAVDQNTTPTVWGGHRTGGQVVAYNTLKGEAATLGLMPGFLGHGMGGLDVPLGAYSTPTVVGQVEGVRGLGEVEGRVWVLDGRHAVHVGVEGRPYRQLPATQTRVGVEEEGIEPLPMWMVDAGQVWEEYEERKNEPADNTEDPREGVPTTRHEMGGRGEGETEKHRVGYVEDIDVGHREGLEACMVVECVGGDRLARCQPPRMHGRVSRLWEAWEEGAVDGIPVSQSDANDSQPVINSQSVIGVFQSVIGETQPQEEMGIARVVVKKATVKKVAVRAKPLRRPRQGF